MLCHFLDFLRSLSRNRNVIIMLSKIVCTHYFSLTQKSQLGDIYKWCKGNQGVLRIVTLRSRSNFTNSIMWHVYLRCNFKFGTYCKPFVLLTNPKLKEKFFHGIFLPKLFYWSRKNFEIQGWRPRIYKNFEITRTICSNSERSEQLLLMLF